MFVVTFLKNNVLSFIFDPAEPVWIKGSSRSTKQTGSSPAVSVGPWHMAHRDHRMVARGAWRAASFSINSSREIASPLILVDGLQ